MVLCIHVLALYYIARERAIVNSTRQGWGKHSPSPGNPYYYVKREHEGKIFPLFDAPDVFFDLFGGVAGHAVEGGKVVEAGGADGSDRAEVLHEGLLAFGADAGYFV